MDIRIFVENEVEYVIGMMRNKFDEYKRTDMMAPFHIKATETLTTLLTEQGLEAAIPKFKNLYREITIENTLKLLLRCKLMFHARKFFLEIFEQIIWYELASKETRQALADKESYKLDVLELNELKLQSGRMYAAGEKVIMQIK